MFCATDSAKSVLIGLVCLFQNNFVILNVTSRFLSSRFHLFLVINLLKISCIVLFVRSFKFGTLKVKKVIENSDNFKVPAIAIAAVKCPQHIVK